MPSLGVLMSKKVFFAERPSEFKATSLEMNPCQARKIPVQDASDELSFAFNKILSLNIIRIATKCSLKLWSGNDFSKSLNWLVWPLSL